MTLSWVVKSSGQTPSSTLDTCSKARRGGTPERTFDQVMAGVGDIKAAADREVARAQHARRPVRSFHDVVSGKDAPDSVGPYPTLTQLKKAVKANEPIAGADPQKKIK